ncbi:MAG TPA: hypothetical protein VN231_11235 [Allosphingosinicella sp.]|nr:hypothetical protein [Allosphingosinicella sp.]
MDSEDTERKHAEELAAGFAAVVFATFLTNLSLDVRSSSADWAILVLSISMPMLVIWWMHFRSSSWPDNGPTQGAAVSGYGLGLAGVALTIGHVSWAAAIAMIAVTIVAILIGAYSEGYMTRGHSPEPGEDLK